MRATIPKVVLVLQALAAALVFGHGCAAAPKDPIADAGAGAPPGPDAPAPFTNYPDLAPGVDGAGDYLPAGKCDLGTWLGKDNVAPSSNPPCGLLPAQVPMFVSIGWDDNASAEGMTWALGALKARNAIASFYMTSVYGTQMPVAATWREARAQGHEIGNHTFRHNNGAKYTVTDWEAEIDTCTEFLTSKAFVAPAAELFGFRTPFLAYNEATLATVQKRGFQYDCSIEEGFQAGADGTNFLWPYTLDGRSPGHSVYVGPDRPEIEPHPGLWELPVYAVIVPPDEECTKYGVPAGLRARLAGTRTGFVASGKITGFDYNMWAKVQDGGFQMSKAEVVATLKYTLDLRLKGNRAPFLFGAHSAYYIAAWDRYAPAAPTAAERRQAIEEFLDYARAQPAVRLTSHKAVLDWLRNPQPP